MQTIVSELLSKIRLLDEDVTYDNLKDDYDINDLKKGDAIDNITKKVDAKIIEILSNQPTFKVEILKSKNPNFKKSEIWTWGGEELYDKHE